MKRVNVKNLTTFLSDWFELDSANVQSALEEFIERENTPSTPGKVFFVKGYSEKSHALFGDTKPLASNLTGLNEDKKKVAKFSYNLEFGPGWISPSKYEKDIKNFLKTENVEFEEMTKNEYAEFLSGGKKSSSKPKTTEKVTKSKPPPPRPPVKKRN
jgi:hypothetical protein